MLRFITALLFVSFLYGFASPSTSDPGLVDMEVPESEPPSAESDPSSTAQLPCLPRELMVGGLARAYGEHLQWAGSIEVGGIVELYANFVTTRWSIVVTNTSGLSCLIAHGVGSTMRTLPEEQSAGL